MISHFPLAFHERQGEFEPMRIPAFIVAVSTLVVLSTGQLHGQTWRELLNQADSLYKAHKLDSAIVVGKLALEKVEVELGEEDTATARVLHRLGVWATSCGDQPAWALKKVEFNFSHQN